MQLTDTFANAVCLFTNLIEINASSEFEVTNVVGDPDEFEIEQRMIFQNLEPLFLLIKLLPSLLQNQSSFGVYLCLYDEVTPSRNPYSVSETFELPPIFVALILFTSSVILPADVTGDPDIENSEPDCVRPMLVTVPVLDGVTWV